MKISILIIVTLTLSIDLNAQVFKKMPDSYYSFVEAKAYIGKNTGYELSFLNWGFSVFEIGLGSIFLKSDISTHGELVSLLPLSLKIPMNHLSIYGKYHTVTGIMGEISGYNQVESEASSMIDFGLRLNTHPISFNLAYRYQKKDNIKIHYNQFFSDGEILRKNMTGVFFEISFRLVSGDDDPRPMLPTFVKVVTIKTCENCHNEVPPTSQVGMICPFCRVEWNNLKQVSASPKMSCSNCKNHVPSNSKVGMTCPFCGAKWTGVK